MNTTHSLNVSQYSCLTPARWLKAALATVDDELARLCANHWRDARLVPVAIPERNGRSGSRRAS